MRADQGATTFLTPKNQHCTFNRAKKIDRVAIWIKQRN
jgi:hypothetical protein